MSRPDYERSQRPQKTETFFTRHVRLITFLVCITLFLLAFWPIAMPQIRSFYHKGDLRPPMSENDVIQVSRIGYQLREAQIAQYISNKVDMGYSNYYYVDVEGEYELLAGFAKDTGLLIFCHLSNRETDEKIDVLKGDVQAFFNQN